MGHFFKKKFYCLNVHLIFLSPNGYTNWQYEFTPQSAQKENMVEIYGRIYGRILSRKVYLKDLRSVFLNWKTTNIIYYWGFSQANKADFFLNALAIVLGNRCIWIVQGRNATWSAPVLNDEGLQGNGLVYSPLWSNVFKLSQAVHSLVIYPHFCLWSSLITTLHDISFLNIHRNQSDLSA